MRSGKDGQEQTEMGKFWYSHNTNQWLGFNSGDEVEGDYFL